jgi:hypothetical protein
MKTGDKLKAKVNLHPFLTKGNTYIVIYANAGGVSTITDVNNQNIFFSLNIQHQNNSIPNVIQVHMYLWDYFDKTIYERKIKLKKINQL